MHAYPARQLGVDFALQRDLHAGGLAVRPGVEVGGRHGDDRPGDAPANELDLVAVLPDVEGPGGLQRFERRSEGAESPDSVAAHGVGQATDIDVTGLEQTGAETFRADDVGQRDRGAGQSGWPDRVGDAAVPIGQPDRPVAGQPVPERLGNPHRIFDPGHPVRRHAECPVVQTDGDLAQRIHRLGEARQGAGMQRPGISVV